MAQEQGRGDDGLDGSSVSDASKLSPPTNEMTPQHQPSKGEETTPPDGAAPSPHEEVHDHARMKRTLLAQSKKIQQLTAKMSGIEEERESLRQQVDALRIALFESSTRAEHSAEQSKRDAMEAAVYEITQDREAFAEARREALERIGELEDALEVALKAAGGVHEQLLDLGLSCEDLGKCSVHLAVAARDAPDEDKPVLAVAGKGIEAIVGVMRAMEGSGVFDLLDPYEEDEVIGPIENPNPLPKGDPALAAPPGGVNVPENEPPPSSPTVWTSSNGEGDSPSSSSAPGRSAGAEADGSPAGSSGDVGTEKDGDTGNAAKRTEAMATVVPSAEQEAPGLVGPASQSSSNGSQGSLPKRSNGGQSEAVAVSRPDGGVHGTGMVAGRGKHAGGASQGTRNGAVGRHSDGEDSSSSGREVRLQRVLTGPSAR